MERRVFIKTFILGSGALMMHSRGLVASAPNEKEIKVVMLYNNIGNSSNFVNKWGFSLWIETKDNAVLFDTGGNASILWNNIENSGIDIDKLSQIVISHNHWDHVNGLPVILEKTDYKPDVFVPAVDLEDIRVKNPKAKLTGVEDAVQVNDFLWSTGILTQLFIDGRAINEQAIIITRDDSMFLFTGCSHPGIVEIVEKAKEIHSDKKLNLVGGGFHLLRHPENQVREISSRLKKLGVRKLAASHCTGEGAIAIFRDEWGDKFVDFNNGNSMKLF